MLIAGRALWFYLEKLAWPQNLTFIYPRWKIEPAQWSQWLFPLGIAAVGTALWICRKRIGRGPLEAMLFFVVTLGPALGFINVFPMRYSFVADHFQYLASMGILAAAVALVTRVTRPGAARFAACILVIGSLGVLTWQRCEAFHDDEILWRDTLAKNPECWMAWNNLGLVREQKGDAEEAFACYDRALQAKPDFADAHINLADLLSRAGHLQEATAHYEEASRIDPGRADAHYNFGLALAQAGKLPEAITQYEDALRLRPNYAEAENNLGNVLWQNGQVPEAIVHLEAALRIAPDSAEAHNNLGALLASQDRTSEAIAHYRKALETKPDYTKALSSLAWLLATGNSIALEDRAAAVPLAERACQLTDHRQPVCLDTLAAAYAAIGRFADAIRVAQQAIALANSSGQTKLAQDIQTRMGLYKANRPFRQSRNAVTP